ncbi:MAG: cupin domain-containing protein, partial [Chitinophagaceae bacterium]|nr:cupin domain-containing protein [Chitinophagaceae bacterium]
MEFPFTISNGYGEHITFLGFEENDMGSNVLALQNEVAPGDGPPMHVHFKQDEKLTVIEGKLAYQMPGGEINYCNEGESVTFNAGTPHKFWNAGDKVMRCKGWISP